MLVRTLITALRARRARGENARGIEQWQGGELAAAERRLRASITLDATGPAQSNLGMVLMQQGRFDEGMDWLLRAAHTAPEHAGVMNNLGIAYAHANRPADAAKYLLRALELDPAHHHAHANLLRPLMEICDWVELERRVDALLALSRTTSLEQWAPRVQPYAALLLDVPRAVQREVTRFHSKRVAQTVSGVAQALARSRLHDSSRPRRMRIGYASADLHDHATSQLAAGMFGMHDRERFEVFAYSWGPDDGSRYRARIREGCDHFVDISGESFADSARRIARDRIDVLVDMKGYTGDSRPEIFASRPAPVQVSFLGYPGSMQADFVDYFVADRVALPDELTEDFSEAPIWLPGSYQVNDAEQRSADSAGARREHGLPEGAMVYGCFNQAYKIDRATFGCWMRILMGVPGSVLWLFVDEAVARRALQDAASRAGVEAKRLVFATHLHKPDHLARLRHADLLLDTFVVNAHTTASDAMHAGIPLLTTPGTTFISRVAASVLLAAGLPDTVAPDRSAYEAMAIALGRNRAACIALRKKLAAARPTARLFDTKSYVRALESAYEHIHSRYRAREAPSPIRIPDR